MARNNTRYVRARKQECYTLRIRQAFFARYCFEGNVHAFLYRARAQHVYLALLVLRKHLLSSLPAKKKEEGWVVLLLLLHYF